MSIAESDRLTFEWIREDILEEEALRLEATIKEIDDNLKDNGFYEGDRKEVERNRGLYIEELKMRRRYLELRLADCAELPQVG